MKSSSYQLGLLAGVIVGILIVAAILWWNNKKYGGKEDYDERQQVLRGKAYQKGFFAMLLYSLLYWALAQIVLQRALMVDGLSSLVCIFVGIAVFAIDCIWHDAFFTARNRPKSYVILYAVVTLCQLPASILNLRNGSVVSGGLLTFDALPIVCGFVFLMILITIVVKLTMDKEED